MTKSINFAPVAPDS